MKKTISIILSALIITTALMGCGKDTKKEGNTNTKNNITASDTKNKVEEKAVETEEADSDENPLANKDFPSFEAKDINDEKVTEKIFKDKKVTMINIWGTFCGPCIEEMPDLQKLYENNKDKGFNLVGIIADGVSDENNKEAKEIIEKTGVKYTNIKPNEVLNKEILSKFPYVPASIFVDSEGKILDDIVPGAASLEAYQKMVDKILGENK